MRLTWHEVLCGDSVTRCEMQRFVKLSFIPCLSIPQLLFILLLPCCEISLILSPFLLSLLFIV